LHYTDIGMFMLGYFILTVNVYLVKKQIRLLLRVSFSGMPIWPTKIWELAFWSLDSTNSLSRRFISVRIRIRENIRFSLHQIVFDPS